jgi:XTP/dITP diphosphohydrolase
LGHLTARLASQNEHKLREWRAALPEWDIELLGVDDYPPETGATYLENARAKARHGWSSQGGWVVGEDSGIEVEALDGRPGIASARWAANGIAEILRLLDDGDERRARYVCEAVAISPDGAEHRGTGVLEGAIARERRGHEGFGYDPIFVPDGDTQTVAELGDVWKTTRSHRALAARALAAAIGDASP